jgi:hypothetical protein
MQVNDNEYLNISLESVLEMEDYTDHDSVESADDDVTVEIISCNCHEIIANPLFDMPIKIEQCSICYEEIKMVNVTVTRCGHAFHSSCIFNSLNYNAQCPLCRTQLMPLPDEDEHDEEDEEDDEEESENESRPLLIGRIVNNIYHNPIAIETFEDLLNEFNEAYTDGIFNNDKGKLWMVLITKILDDTFITDDYDDFGNDKYNYIFTYGFIIGELMKIFNRTKIIKKNIQYKADKIKKNAEISNMLNQHLINKLLHPLYDKPSANDLI